MTDLFLQLIFDFLCGILYVVGLMNGFNYEEFSVYVCIYAWPILCAAMPTIIALVALYNWVKKQTLWSTINLAISTGTAYIFWRIANLLIALYTRGYETHPRLETIHDKFTACLEDLMMMSDQLNMTYAELNLWIYCVLFLLISAVMCIWFEITIPRKWIINRLWCKHSPLFSSPEQTS